MTEKTAAPAPEQLPNDDGGFAYPFTLVHQDVHPETGEPLAPGKTFTQVYPGMTLLDALARDAMMGLLTGGLRPQNRDAIVKLARSAYSYGLAMIMVKRELAAQALAAAQAAAPAPEALADLLPKGPRAVPRLVGGDESEGSAHD